jgi:hypothetical protein
MASQANRSDQSQEFGKAISQAAMQNLLVESLKEIVSMASQQIEHKDLASSVSATPNRLLFSDRDTGTPNVSDMSEADTDDFQPAQNRRRPKRRNSGQMGSSVDKTKQARSRSPSSSNITHSLAQNQPKQGTTVVIKGLEEHVINNQIKISRALDDICPSITIKSMRTVKDQKLVIVQLWDEKSAQTLVNAHPNHADLVNAKFEMSKTPPSKLSVLITGVDPSIEEEEVASELVAQGGFDIKSIKRIYHKGSGSKTFKVKVTLDKLSEKNQLLAEGAYLGYTRHRVIDFIEAPQIPICFKCQQLGHTVKDCRNNICCVRCGGSITKEIAMPLETPLLVLDVMGHIQQHIQAAQLTSSNRKMLLKKAHIQ